MISGTLSFILALITTCIFAFFQIKYFNRTKKFRILYQFFFKTEQSYSTKMLLVDGEEYIQLNKVGYSNSDLNQLIEEINHYVIKTKGTTDFSVIQNKVERKLNMRYEQSVIYLAFPTYLGLMGTFLGVFVGILTFIFGFDSANTITDESIKNLLSGVLISMITSLCDEQVMLMAV